MSTQLQGGSSSPNVTAGLIKTQEKKENFKNGWCEKFDVMVSAFCPVKYEVKPSI